MAPRGTTNGRVFGTVGVYRYRLYVARWALTWWIGTGGGMLAKI